MLAHAPEPILVTDDDGKSWKPLGPGLRTEQMLRVYASPDGWWASLAHGGLMRYDARKEVLAARRIGHRRGGMPSPLPRREISRASVSKGAQMNDAPQPLQQIVNDMAFQFEWLVCRHRYRIVDVRPIEESRGR